MGLRFRKSINLGGLRLNLSNSGVGYSVGKKGFRVSKSATGRTTSTISIPNTGISYTKTLNKKTTSKNKKDKNIDNTVNKNVNFQKVDSNAIYISNSISNNKSFNKIYQKDYENLNTSDIYKNIKNKKNLNIFSTILILFAILFFISKYFIIVGVIGLVLKIILLFNKYTFNYVLKEEEIDRYNMIENSLNALSKSKTIWLISNNSRKIVKVSNKLPWYINNNMNIYHIDMKNEKLYFTPSYFVIVKGSNIKGYKYENLNIDNNTVEYIEDGVKPSDAVIIGYRWKYMTKDNEPDKRYTNNPKLPVCNYGSIKYGVSDKNYLFYYSKGDELISLNSNENDTLLNTTFEKELLKKEEKLKLQRKLEEKNRL